MWKIRHTSRYLQAGQDMRKPYEIVFDPVKISYEKLLDLFWKNIDPTTLNRQFADTGSQYRTAIFYTSEEQRKEG